MSEYSAQQAFITSTGSFLPGRAVSNEQMEDVLGLVNGKRSRFRRQILKSNGIESRYYAIDGDGKANYLNEELAALAIENALDKRNMLSSELDMIAVGTTTPDILAPGIASMVHGRLGGGNTDILSASGICGAGAASLKAAALAVIAGQHASVVACGSERSSVLLRGNRFKAESQIKRQDDGLAESYRYFNADFLRWMLSDGAGAFIIENKPSVNHPSFKIQWVESTSYAHELPTCMYLGSQNPNTMRAEDCWLEQSNIDAMSDSGVHLLRQDVKLLAENGVRLAAEFLAMLQEKYGHYPVDHFLPHISSFFFYDRLNEAFVNRGIDLPADKWFTNLKQKGNTGAASIYIAFDEFIHTQNYKPGNNILLFIPESGRFSMTYAMLTVV